MERDTERLSNDNYDLTYEAWINGEGNGDSLSLLFPELKDDYFKDREEVLTPVRWNPLEKITGKNVSAHVGRRDLNKSVDEFDLEDRRPNYAWEIGINMSF